MNCLDVRRSVLADPRRLAEDVRRHAEDCRACEAFIDRTRRFNGAIERALRLPVPECLPARILLRNSNAKSRLRIRFGLSLAASLLAAALVWQQWPDGEHALREELVAYAARGVERVPASTAVSEGDLEALYRKVGITVDPSVGPIATAKPCYIQNALGAHLTLMTASGPVSVLILPSAEIDGAFEFTVDGRLSGRMLPCPKGSMAIISADADAIDAVRLRFEGAVGWHDAAAGGV